MVNTIKLVQDITKLQSEQAEIEEAIAFKKQALAAALGEGEQIVGDNETGFVKAIVYRHKAFNEAYGKKLYPELWEKAAETKKVVTAAGAKTKLTEDEYALFQKQSDGLSVKLELINE